MITFRYKHRIAQLDKSGDSWIAIIDGREMGIIPREYTDSPRNGHRVLDQCPRLLGWHGVRGSAVGVLGRIAGENWGEGGRGYLKTKSSEEGRL